MSESHSQFAHVYSRMSSDELLRVMSDRASLVPEAAAALDSECAKRGLDKAGAEAYQKQMAVAVARDVAASKEQRAAELRAYRRTVWPQRGIFFGGAILTALFAEYVFGLPSDAIRVLTKMLLSMAMAASALGWAFGGHWLTIKRTCVTAVLLYGGVLVWILLEVSGHQRTQH